MKILIVINSFYTRGNGLAAATRRMAAALKKEGDEVRILSRSNPDPKGIQPDYALPSFRLPGIFGKLTDEQGYAFAGIDRKVMEKAVEWADVIHFEEPFPAQAAVASTASEKGVPCTATYHIHPENLLASVGLMHNHTVNDWMMRLWCRYVFNRCVCIQAPSENAARRLETYHVPADIHIISNGILPGKIPAFDRERTVPPYTVLCIGRYSVEKDPLTLLRAMRYSRFSDRIQLVFAGRGPLMKKMEDESIRLMEEGVLSYRPVMEFLNYDELQQLSVNADLIVHCAEIEVEGMSLTETLKNGRLVPVIAEAPYSAASQFALSPCSRFRCGSPEQLADRIDYWLSHPVRRRKEAQKYLTFTSRYAAAKSVMEFRNMLSEACEKNQNR